MNTTAVEADVCLVAEGSYPYVPGGVSTWAHDLIRAQADLRFHLLVLVADGAPRTPCFELPSNVVGISNIVLQKGETRMPRRRFIQHLVEAVEQPLTNLLDKGGREDFRAVLHALRRYSSVASRAALMNSEPAFEMLQRMYEKTVPGTSFLSYFWTWRALAGGLFAVLLAPLPRARVYHAISTGYAGLALARAVLETGRPGLLTEHGIYTNERRVEVALASWLRETARVSLDLERRHRDLRDVWVDAFTGYSRACYESCSRITTLYAGNQALQLRDGAPVDRLAIVPNGIDFETLSRIERDPAARRPTVALIGRAVPIKDIKTFIRAAALLREVVPDVCVKLLGPTDEDPAYFAECHAMVAHLGLVGSFEFCGRVRVHDWLGRIDVVVLTSISEAQPLVLLEAGAAGVPSVATDVGCCRDLLLGRPDEEPPLGPGGIVTPLANPMVTAQALATLLLDDALRARYGRVMRERAERYYNCKVVDRQYRDMYEEFVHVPDADALAAAAE